MDKKRGVGQPYKGDDGKRVSVTMRITPKESAAWHAAASEAGISFSRYVLGFVRKHHEKLGRKGK
ncbi:MAG: toxin-antitoxin system HicB family antitoxin [Planctomycetota bacterium]|jgi:predicted HicB family RNase H-like nuclease|nr:toxin-antitoxin system HicB family antitoxin [Planctomycetota bacterium]